MDEFLCDCGYQGTPDRSGICPVCGSKMQLLSAGLAVTDHMLNDTDDDFVDPRDKPDIEELGEEELDDDEADEEI